VKEGVNCHAPAARGTSHDGLPWQRLLGLSLPILGVERSLPLWAIILHDGMKLDNKAARSARARRKAEHDAREREAPNTSSFVDFALFCLL